MLETFPQLTELHPCAVA